MMTAMRIVVGVCLLSMLGASAETVDGSLNGKSGKLFKVAPDQRTLEFLKETEYDPKTGIGKSRFTVHWNEDVEIVESGEAKDFSAVKERVVASFHGIDEANAEAMKKGEAFVARVATLYFGAGDELATGPEDEHHKVFGWFTPDGKGRQGTILIDGRAVPVSLRSRHWRIFTSTPRSPEDLTKGFWKATLSGTTLDGRFVADAMEVEPLPDPRETDDPKLPRVLVIGDSISMNYHDAAKEALAGVANYHRIEGNAFSSAHGVANAELWLGNHHEEGFGWDVIQFNHGLHDLKQAYDKETDAFGEYAMPIPEYQANLEKLIAKLRGTGAKLVWCSTTPVPNHNKGTYARRKGAAKEFNEAALEVIKRHPEVIVTDLYGVIAKSPVFDAWRRQNDVHFYKAEEREVLGEAVAAGIRKALE